jgi:transcriptional regulator with XRE-family HTH domain
MEKDNGLKKFLETIGKNFRAIRIARKLHIETVARELKISPSSVERMEKGDHDWEVDLIVRLCNYYNVTPKDVIFEKKAKELITITVVAPTIEGEMN